MQIVGFPISNSKYQKTSGYRREYHQKRSTKHEDIIMNMFPHLAGVSLVLLQKFSSGPTSRGTKHETKHVVADTNLQVKRINFS